MRVSFQYIPLEYHAKVTVFISETVERATTVPVSSVGSFFLELHDDDKQNHLVRGNMQERARARVVSNERQDDKFSL